MKNDTATHTGNLFWLADVRNARAQGGFLLITPGEPAPAFCTADPNLVGQLDRIFSSYDQTATPYLGDSHNDIDPQSI